MSEHDTGALVYIVLGRDPYGRKFSGLYNEEDARSLAKAERLNIVLDRVSHNVVHFTD